jgi:hypothetical protein
LIDKVVQLRQLISSLTLYIGDCCQILAKF